MTPVPARYDAHPADQFAGAVAANLREDMDILDVGSGRRPALTLAERPEGARYTGLDLSGAELERAPTGSYDAQIVADLTEHRPELVGCFDLVISWQVLEHVRPMDHALANLRSYLRPGGALVAMFSGRFSAFGVLNTLVPARAGVWLMRTLLRRDPEMVFPAHYHRCYDRALRPLLRQFGEYELRPLYQGGSYFNFFLPLRRAYFVYENWAERTARADLATHYLLAARRAS